MQSPAKVLHAVLQKPFLGPVRLVLSPMKVKLKRAPKSEVLIQDRILD